MAKEKEVFTKKLKKFAINQGADLIGIAPVERFEHAPEEHKPEYFLSDAKSVVVIAAAFPKGVCDVWGTYEEPHKTAGPYMWYGHVVGDIRLILLSNKISLYLEKNGYKTVTFPDTFSAACYRFLMKPDRSLGDYLYFPDFSSKHAAVAAGLGEFGLNNLLLTPKFGPRQRVNTIITDAPLKPDPMYDGPKLCEPDVC